MPRALPASPQISVRLYKTISRKTIDGQSAVSARYKGKSPYIDLTPFLGDTSSVRTSKSVREPAGAWSITIADQARQTMGSIDIGLSTLETVYGLVEPMDVIEIRMWNGLGTRPAVLPIKMRGFVSEVQRGQIMGDDGKPQRQVIISGQDYGKIWQMYQILYLAAYAEGKTLLTSFALAELFGGGVVSTMKAGEFIATIVDKIINPFLENMKPDDDKDKKRPSSSVKREQIEVGQKMAKEKDKVKESVADLPDQMQQLQALRAAGQGDSQEAQDLQASIVSRSQEAKASTEAINDKYQPRYDSLGRELKVLNMGSPIQLLKKDITVKHGVINLSNMDLQGTLYDIAKYHGDVGVWNELYIEDREDGVYCVYRPIPALFLSTPKGAKSRKIQDDAPDPVYVPIPDSAVTSISVARSDANVANFFWVQNGRYDIIDDMQRKLAAIPSDDDKVSLKGYPNSDPKYYGTRPMFATTQQGDDAVTSGTSGLPEGEQKKRGEQFLSWLDRRRKQMMDMNKDNVVYERGTIRLKGGPMRKSGECMKAGDYAQIQFGTMSWEAYVVQIDDEFAPYQGYTTTLTFERGTGFAERAKMEGGTQSPWLAEQSSRRKA